MLAEGAVGSGSGIATCGGIAMGPSARLSISGSSSAVETGVTIPAGAGGVSVVGGEGDGVGDGAGAGDGVLAGTSTSVGAGVGVGVGCKIGRGAISTPAASFAGPSTSGVGVGVPPGGKVKS